MYHYRVGCKGVKRSKNQSDERSSSKEGKNKRRRHEYFLTSCRLPRGALKTARRPFSAASHSRLKRIPSCVYLRGRIRITIERYVDR